MLKRGPLPLNWHFGANSYYACCDDSVPTVESRAGTKQAAELEVAWDNGNLL